MELQQTQIIGLDFRIENRQRLTAMKKEIEKQIDDETKGIKESMEAAGLVDYDAGDVVATLSMRERATLDKTELISLGVSTDLIKRATKVSTYIQLDVRGKKA
jgi:hypothetical protein